MKAMVYQSYGSPDNLGLAEINIPSIIADEVLVRARAASVNWIDWHFLTGTPFLARIMAGLLKPKNKVLGIDLAGRVEAIGENVTQFQIGDEVFGSTNHGCFAEYVCVNESELVKKPANLTFEEAAAVPGAATPALQALRDHGHVQPDDKVLINGASGGVGSFAVQIAKSMGAHVTGVCSTTNLDMVRSIGADQVIDYTQKDFTQSENRYDLIFDVVANRSFSNCKGALTSQGIYITSEFSPILLLREKWISLIGTKKMVALPPNPPNQMDLVYLNQLLEVGKIQPVIDRCYSLSEVPEALTYFAKGHSKGKVIITI